MREILQTTVQSESLEMFPVNSILDWTQEMHRRYTDLNYALAHADDGVVWGRFDLPSQSWLWSGDVFAAEQFSPYLRPERLQQIRLFGKRAEVFAWREGRTWRGRAAQEGNGPHLDYFDEAQLLWGKAEGTSRNGFTLMREGQQGLRHAVPLIMSTGRNARLITRSYLNYDPGDGHVFVAFSRLVELS